MRFVCPCAMFKCLIKVADTFFTIGVNIKFECLKNGIMDIIKGMQKNAIITKINIIRASFKRCECDRLLPNGVNKIVRAKI